MQSLQNKKYIYVRYMHLILYNSYSNNNLKCIIQYIYINNYYIKLINLTNSTNHQII